MQQNKTTGAFHFYGTEYDDAILWMWSNLMDLSWRGKIIMILRILFKHPPRYVWYKTAEFHMNETMKKINKIAGRSKL